MVSQNDPVMPWGLCELYDNTKDAENDQISVDIVAVHGLGAHPDHAWVRHKNVAEGIKNDVHWLTRLLPQTLRQHRPSLCLRVFCYNYSSAWFGKSLSKNRLKTVANRLLDDIHNVRLLDTHGSARPLIFLGHSFGGLVIEQAIVMASSVASPYIRLLDYLGGVLLFGTPHKGSKVQKWGAILAQLAQMIEYGETILMDDVDEHSMKIFDLRFDFMQIVIRTGLAEAILCFCENRPTNYVRRISSLGGLLGDRVSAMVVEEPSAVLDGLQYIVLESDHLKLNKFAGEHDGNYVSVSSSIARIAAEAPRLVQNRRRASTATIERYDMVHRERVVKFVGREDELGQILACFSARSDRSPRVMILHALGGQGKSQIALEYCRRSRQTYRGIFWINANSEALVLQSFQRMLMKLTSSPSSSLPQDAEERVEMVKHVLEYWQERWLIVFDNYDDPIAFPRIRRFIPSAGNGDVLITSRHRGLERLGRVLKVPPLPLEAGTELLLRDFDQDAIRPDHQVVASAILGRLGRLALAIDQAAAYIQFNQIPLDRLNEFLGTYEKQRRTILKYIPESFWEYSTEQFDGESDRNRAISAFTTWEMSFQQLKTECEYRSDDLGHFLVLSAFLSPSGVEEFVYRWYWEEEKKKVAGMTGWLQIFNLEDGDSDDDLSSEDGETDGGEARSRWNHWSHDLFWKLVDWLHKLSLAENIHREGDNVGATFQLHPLIRDWLQMRESREDRQRYTDEAIVVIEICIQRTERGATAPDQRVRLIKHVDTCLDNDARFGYSRNLLSVADEKGITTGLFAWFYQCQSLFKKSEHLWRIVVQTQRSKLGERDPDTLVSMNNLAVVLRNQGKYEEAEGIHWATLELRQEVLGKKNPDTLGSMNNLAEVLRYQGKYKEAEGIHRATLELKQEVLGEKNPDTLGSMNNLAEVLSYQGKYEETEGIHRATLELSKEVLGEKNPDTLGSMNNLAVVLRNQGKYEEAEGIHRATLELKQEVLGEKNPSTLVSMNNLVMVLRYQGKYEEADSVRRCS